MKDLFMLLLKDLSFFILTFSGLYLYQLFFWLVDYKLIKLFRPSSSSVADANKNLIGLTEYIFTRHKPSGIIGKFNPFIDILGWGLYSIICIIFINTFIIFTVAFFFGSLLFFVNMIHSTIEDEKTLDKIKKINKFELLFISLYLLFFNRYQNIHYQHFYENWARISIVILSFGVTLLHVRLWPN
jgi:hypothetical protein